MTTTHESWVHDWLIH